MAGKTQNPVMDNVPVKRGPGRPKGSNNNTNPPADSSARTKAMKAIKAKIKEMGAAGPTADVVISRAENVALTGWQVVMGESIRFGDEVWTVTVNGEALGTFT